MSKTSKESSRRHVSKAAKTPAVQPGSSKATEAKGNAASPEQDTRPVPSSEGPGEAVPASASDASAIAISAAASAVPSSGEPADSPVQADAGKPSGDAASATGPSAAKASTPPSPTPLAGTSPASQPAPVWIQLDSLDASTAFRLRPEGDVETLATSIVREGQISPIHVRPVAGAPGKFQVVDGFRRVAALRLIMRRRVLAHVHAAMPDGDALSFSLASLLETKSAAKPELEALKARLVQENRLSPSIEETLTQAISPESLELAAETIDCAQPEPDPCALVDSVLAQLGALNRDLSAVARCWDVLPREVRDVILQQLNYSAEMARYLRRLPGGLF